MNDFDSAGGAAAALNALRQPGLAIAEAEVRVPAKPGLYAISGASAVWVSLGLGEPPDHRPLYVGKAERTLKGRDVRTHFATGKTGGSTVRRSLAGLLASDLDLRGQPRNPDIAAYYANFGLEAAGDARLTAWMVEHLRLAVWPSPPGTDLDDIETKVLVALMPPLNLAKVRTSWFGQVDAGRRVLADEARAWTPPDDQTPRS